MSEFVDRLNVALEGGYMASRTLGVGPFATPLSAGELNEQDRIGLADFGTRTVDSTLARAVTEAFRADLSRSPTVKLADEAHVSEELRPSWFQSCSR